MKNIKYIPLFFLLVSCNPSGVEKPDKNMMLPDDKLVPVLTDTYLAGGILDIYSIRSTWGKRDSIDNYRDIALKHGCTLEQIDATMQYYFLAKPKKIEKIFDKVIDQLLEMESLTHSDTPKEPVKKENSNLWTGKVAYSLPQDFAKDPLWFDIPLEKPGRYTLEANIQVFADDKSLDPRVTVFFNYTDSAGVESRDYWEEVPLKKDGRVTHVKISKYLKDTTGTHIQGWLLNHSANQGIWEKHATIRSIKLTVVQDSTGQDSIRQDSIRQDSIWQDSISRDSIMQDSIIQNSIIQESKREKNNRKALNNRDLIKPEPADTGIFDNRK